MATLATHGNGSLATKTTRASEDYIEIRGRDNNLLFRFDPVRDLIEIKPKQGPIELVDLRPYRRKAGVYKVQGRHL